MSKKFGAVLNSVGQPHRRESHIGRISTVGSGGRSLSVNNGNNSQLRNLVPIMPYGISSSPVTGLMAFVLESDNDGNDGIVGVYDHNKPNCNPGDCIMYSSSGATVKCVGDKVLINDVDVLDEIEKLKQIINNL